MKKFLLLFAILGIAWTGDLPPVGPTQPGTTYHSLPQTATLASAACACTTVGQATCTVAMGPVDLSGFDDVTITMTNTGSNTITNGLLEQSADGTNWESIVSAPFSGLAASATKDVNYLGVYKNIRIEACSTSGSSSTVTVDAKKT